MSELKPCPFCGESKLLYSGGCGFRYDDDDNQIRLFRVHCRTCKGRTGLFESLDEAVEAWNKRTNSTTIQPSAQPEPCEDAVSREVLKDGFTEMCNLICPYTKKQQHVMCGSCLMGTAFDVLEATPSVTPKQRTGKWIEDKGQQTLMQNFIERGEVWRVCSVCGAGHMIGHKYAIDKAYHDRHHNFCPHCGAKMREVTT